MTLNLQVQEYLLSHSLDDLIKEHGIYPGFGNKDQTQKFSLNYDQIESRNSDPLTHECRGLILAKTDGSPVVLSEVVGETVVLARPFNRFFNLGQGEATSIDFTDPETVLMDKVDGTLIILHFDKFKERWCVATRAVPDADTSIDGFEDFTFRRLFELCIYQCAVDVSLANPKFAQEAAKSHFHALTSTHCLKHLTYCFELTSPENQVVVHYPKKSLTLLAIRNTKNGEELPIEQSLIALVVPCVAKHQFSSVDQVVEFILTKNPAEYEGMVAMDKGYNRVKMKHPGYLALSSLKSSATSSPRRLLELVLLERADDVMPLLPDHAKVKLVEMQRGLMLLCQTYDTHHKKIKETCTTRKDYAIQVQTQGLWIAPLINMYLDKVSSMKGFLLSQQHKKGEDQQGWSDTFLDVISSEILKVNL